MPDNIYVFSGILLAATVTWALRAIPFAMLAPLRNSALLSYLGAVPVRTAVFAATADFGGPGAAGRDRRVKVAAGELAAVLASTPRRASEADDFVDFATLLGAR